MSPDPVPPTKDRTLLVVEDDPGLQSQLRWSFDGFQVAVAGDREAALAQLRLVTPAVVTLDLGLPPDPGGVSEGFALLRDILHLAPSTKVVVVTGHDDRDNAIRAVGMGAYDFYEKPVDPEILNLVATRAARLRYLEEENRRLQARRLQSPFAGLIASSPQMLKVCQSVERLGPTNATTLILGESGTGKELLVRALHAIGERRHKRLVAINCAAIPETLLESELFGYERGAFTGAAKQTPGKFEVANGGILFLDEIGDLPLSLQAKLLRFLQERVIERVGGRTEIPVDVRVVCATHQNLPGMVKEGRFREDLFYRINETSIQVPPLRDRDGDALVLARAFLERFSREQQRPLKGFTQRALGVIEHYPWPGNVRELENRVKRAVIMADGPEVNELDLELGEAAVSPEPFNLRELREMAEKRGLERALRHADGNLTRAADLLGITRPTLYGLLEKYGMKPD